MSLSTLLAALCCLTLLVHQRLLVGVDAQDSLVSPLLSRQPVFQLAFGTSPNAAIGTSPAWTWAASDPTDPPSVAAQHQGVAILNGNPNSWIDLTTATGAQSAGAVMPMIGGAGNYAYGSALCGWSFEFVIKAWPAVATAGSKVMELSNALTTTISASAPGDNWSLMWSQAGNYDIGAVDSGYKLEVENFNNQNTVGAMSAFGKQEFAHPTPGAWYHIVVGMQPVGSATSGAGNWYIYVNGVQQQWANYFAPNASLAPIEGANYPLAVARSWMRLGSDSAGAPPCNVTIDAVRVYDYLLPYTTVQALAGAYGLNVPIPTQTSYRYPSLQESSRISGLVPTPPIFNAPFEVNPCTNPAIPCAAQYQWMSVDPADSPAQQQLHTGLIFLNGSNAAYIDLTTASGPNSVGVVLPLIGTPGSGSGATQGLTVELVVKFPSTSYITWRPKVFDWGQGGGTDTFDMTFNTNTNLALENQNNIAPTLPQAYSLLNFLTTPAPIPANTWFHLTWVLSSPNLTAYTATWNAYVNGVASITPTAGLFPLPVVRDFAYLGGSDWADANLIAVFDVVRVYDYALSASQVAALANQYLVATPCAASTVLSPVASGDQAALGVVPRPAVFNANFSVNPAAATGTTPAWTWQATDGLDTCSIAQSHQGVAMLNGAGSSYIDLTTARGAQSAGVAMPVLGGAGYYAFGNAMCGWSFEMVLKFPTVSQVGVYVLTLSNPMTGDNLALQFSPAGYFDAGDDGGWKVEWLQNDNVTAVPITPQGQVEFLHPNAGQWYHIVLAMQPVGSATSGAANWFVYVNGQLLPYAAALQPGTTLTSMQGANYPLAVSRPTSVLGTAIVTIDSFRVYDYLLPAATVSALAGAYGLNIATPVQVPYQFPNTPETTAMQAIVPTPPIFNAPFAQNPTMATLVASSTNYAWVPFDVNDTPANQALHQGIIVLNGSATSYVDLTTTLGPNSIGLLLPIIGLPGSGSPGTTQGLSVEVSVKFPTVNTAWWRPKVFDWGQGGGTDTFDLTFDTGSKLALENQNNFAPANTYYLDDFLTSPQQGVWYHFVWVLSQPNLQTYTSTWTVYVNGQQAGQFANQNFPLPVTRTFAWLGGSDWNDPNLPCMLDTVRVYDYALSATTVTQLAGLYQPSSSGSTGGAGTSTCATSNAGSGDVLAAAAVSRAPVFNANFSTPPICTTGASTNWQWGNTDGIDTGATATLHQGVAMLNGLSSSYIDLTTARGAQSAGVAMPVLGGAGYYAFGNAMCGWSFEMVLKFPTVSQVGVYVLTLSNPMTGDNLALQFSPAGYFDAGDDGGWKVEWLQNDNVTAVPITPQGQVEFLHPNAGQWYHIVLAMQPVGSATSGAANWFVYVNGQLLPYAAALQPGTTLTSMQGANYPLAVSRPTSVLGTAIVTIDSFRVYDYLLPAATVSALAGAYGLNIATPVQVPYQFPNTPETTAMQAIVPTPPIFNAPFAQNPTMATLVASSTNYAWVPFDVNDTPANQALHQGIIVLNGSATSYVDLTTTLGPNSIGLLLPIIGLPGSGSPGTTQGLSVEVSVKFPTVNTAWWRPKVFDWGQGGGTDTFDLTFDTGSKLALENQNNFAPANTYYLDDFLTSPQQGVWYHFVWVLSQPNLQTYTSTWTVYVNGQQAGQFANQNFPLPVTRTFAWLGGSDWNDPNLPCMLDTVRVYDYALSAATVAKLAALKGASMSSSAAPAPVGGSSSYSRPSMSSSAAAAAATSAPVSGGGGGSSSSLSGGAIAGIVIGSVVGAGLLLCVVCVFFGPWAVRKGKKEMPEQGVGAYNEVEPSTTQSTMDEGQHVEETGGVEMA